MTRHCSGQSLNSKSVVLHSFTDSKLKSGWLKCDGQIVAFVRFHPMQLSPKVMIRNQHLNWKYGKKTSRKQLETFQVLWMIPGKVVHALRNNSLINMQLKCSESGAAAGILRMEHIWAFIFLFRGWFTTRAPHGNSEIDSVIMGSMLWWLNKCRSDRGGWVSFVLSAIHCSCHTAQTCLVNRRHTQEELSLLRRQAQIRDVRWESTKISLCLVTARSDKIKIFMFLVLIFFLYMSMQPYIVYTRGLPEA